MSKFNLKTDPEYVTWPSSHYVFIEKVGPFQQTAPAAWQEFHQSVGDLIEELGFVAMSALYKIEPKMVYRAGAMVKTAPKDLPPGFSYEKFLGGSYAKFTYVGSYAYLGEVSGLVWDSVRKLSLPRRDDYCIENYANDPKVTPAEKLITEILIPTTAK